MTVLATFDERELSAARAELAGGQLEHYMRCRDRGTSHALAMVLASRRAPLVNRRDERWRLTDEKATFRRRVPKGKYQAGLARYPGDPEAFVSSMGDAKKVAARRGLQILDEPANARSAVQNAPDDDSMCELGNNLGAA